jgi:uncharacterized protein involved in propanediol utilization
MITGKITPVTSVSRRRALRSADGTSATHLFFHTGYGSSIAHHGELLQGMFENGDGLHRGLVTLPCEVFGSETTFEIDFDSPVVTVEPAQKTKARRAAELTIIECGGKGYGGRLKVSSDIPICLGLGSSTGDVISTIRAVASAHKICLTAKAIAELAVQAELASDSTMYGNRAVLFGQREAIVIEDFGGSLPPLVVLGFNTDSTGMGVDTIAFPPAEYHWKEVKAFQFLRGLMRKAISSQDPALIGTVASASARINQRHLPKPRFDEMERLAEDVEALGLQVAHSGTVAGLLFDPRSHHTQEQIQMAQVLLAELGLGPTWCFGVSNERREVAA